MLKMVDGTGIIGVDMICPLGVSTPQPPNYDRVELEGAGMLVLPNSLDAPLERLELGGKTEQVQTTGAQLFDSKLFGTTSNTGGATVTNNGDGTFSVSGNGTLTKIFNISHEYSREQTLSMLKIGKLHARASANVLPYPSFLIFSNGEWTELNMDSTTEKTADITEEMLNSEDLKSRFRFFGVINNAIKSGTVKVMLYQDGNGAYEPYTGGKPSPSPEYPQEIKNVGKWNEGTQKYEVDVKVTNAEQNWSKEQTLTLTSDRPITKWDRLVEQGGQIGWLYGTKIYAATGSENYFFGIEDYYSGISTNMYTLNASKMGKEAVCDRLTRVRDIWFETCKDGLTINSGKQIHMRFFNSLLGVNDDATKEEKKAAYIAYLKKEYEKGTPYEIVYQSLEPEFIPLPQSEQNAIRALKTYYPTTVITADGGELDPDIKVTYRKEI